MKKIIVTCFWDLSPTIENALETALHFNEQGYEVRVFDGASVVSFREFDRSHKACTIYRFLRPIVRGVQIARKYGNILWQSYDGFEYYDSLAVKGQSKLWQVESFEDARNVKIDDFEVGAAALSSVIHVMNEVPSRDTDFKSVRPLWVNLVKSGIEVYKYFERVLEDDNLEVATFNGRFINDAAVIAAAERKNRSWWIYENGNVNTHFCLLNFPVHSLPDHQAQISGLKERMSWEEIESEGESYFANKVLDPNFNPFASSFDPAATLDLTTQIDASKTVFFFQTSDDEYYSLAGDVGSTYKTDWYDQKELVIFLAQSRSDYLFVVRMHPHMRHKSKGYQDRWLKGIFPRNVLIIPPDSPISSYGLLERDGPIIVTGSSLGLEAIYRKKPAIVAGATWWSHIDGAYEARTADEVIGLIDSYAELEVTSVEGALMCGAYQMSSFNGVRARLTERTALHTALFDNVNLFEVSN